MLLEGDSREFDKMYSERDYSSDSEKKTLVGMSEAKYDLENNIRVDKDNNYPEQPVFQKRSLYRPPTNQLYGLLNQSIPNIRNFHSQYHRKKDRSNKNLLDYLKEEARKESSRINSRIFENRSFSPVYEPEKEEVIVEKTRSRSRNYEEIDSFNSRHQNKRQKSPKKRVKTPGRSAHSSPKTITVVNPDNLSNLSDNPNIESFADFSDAMFKIEVRNKTKVFVCPEQGCHTELPSLSRIKRHYLVHTNLKPFECLNPNCSKRFSRKDNMIQHYRTHCHSNR